MHTSLDALQAIRERHPFATKDVKRVTVHAADLVVKHVGWEYQPAGLTSAQMNLPFCMATLLLEGDVFVGQFDEACVGNEARIALSRKVEVREDPAITALGSKFRHMVKVTVRLKDGTVMDETVEAARGSEKNFASPADILAKFKKLAGKRLSPAQCDRIMNLVLGLVALEDPLRPEVPAAVAACRTAGIRVLMMTGDHPATALAIARGLGLHADAAAFVIEYLRHAFLARYQSSSHCRTSFFLNQIP